MDTHTQVVEIGDSLGIVMPEQILTELGVQPGDSVTLTRTPEGILVTSEFTRQMAVMRYAMERHRDVLRMLADS